MFQQTNESMPFGQFRFEVLRDIGAGGLGRVDKIIVKASNTPEKPVDSVWARKRLSAAWASHPEMAKRLEREIAALKLMDHPGIIPFEGESLPGGERFFVMPFYQSNLRRHIASGSWTGHWRNIIHCAIGLATALEYAHGLGFIHRDLKPDNILFDPGGPLVIADWGIGYFVHRESKVLTKLTRGGMGTEYYCSLEQWASGKCDNRGDVYSLGMTLDEWLHGRQRSITVGMGVGAADAGTMRGGAARLQRLLSWMTQPFPNQRPESMATVLTELRVIANEG